MAVARSTEGRIDRAIMQADSASHHGRGGECCCSVVGEVFGSAVTAPGFGFLLELDGAYGQSSSAKRQRDPMHSGHHTDVGAENDRV